MIVKITKVKILTIAIMIALIVQYSIGIDSMLVYADDKATEIALEDSGEDIVVEKNEIKKEAPKKDSSEPEDDVEKTDGSEESAETEDSAKVDEDADISDGAAEGPGVDDAEGSEADVTEGQETDGADASETDIVPDAEAASEADAEAELEVDDADAEEDADKAVKQTVKAGGAEITAEYDKTAFDGEVTFAADKLTKKQMKRNDDAVDELVGEDVTATTLFAFDLYFLDQNGKRLEPTDDVKISIEFDKAQNDNVLGELRVVHFKHDGTAEYIDNASISDDASSTEFTNDQFSTYAEILESVDIVEVETWDQFNAVINDLNTNGGSKAIKMMNDLAFANNNPQVRKGELTILGEGHTIYLSISVLENGTLNLGADGYEKTLDLPPGRSDLCVVNVEGHGNLNIYKGVTIRDCTRAGQAGGVQSVGKSVVNMYGGTITNCHSYAVSGGIYLDGHSVFNMHDGEITNCTGQNGGAVGLGGGSPFGPLESGPVSFNMYGGTIKDCEDKYIGGGAVCCAYSRGPVSVNISGGTIENCKCNRYGYGGAICFYNTYEKATFSMVGGTIKNCSAGGYGMGGGISFYYSDTYTSTIPELSFTIDGGSVTGCSCKDATYGYAGGIFFRTPVNAGASIQLKSGLVKGNKAKLAGGIMVLNGPAIISDGFGLHNNSATLAGDDLYNNGANVTLGTADTSATLESTGHKITGWYYDGTPDDEGEEGRWKWDPDSPESNYLKTFGHTGTVYSEEYAIKAAHGDPVYTVEWVNDDGTELETDTEVPYGATPSYDGDTPTKEPTAEYTYEFAGWDPEISEVTDDITYTATYTPKAREYTVRFDSNGGSSVSPVTVKYGDPVEQPADPTRSGYTFDGWMLNGEPYDFSTPVTGPLTLTAKWTQDPAPTPGGDVPDDPDDPDEPDDDPVVTPDDEPDDDVDPTTPARPANPARPAAAPAAPVAPAAPADQETIDDDPTPQADPETIPDEEPPKADEPEQGNWALLNLIAAALTTLGAALALFRKREEDDDNDRADEDEDEEERSEKRKLTIAKIVGAALAAASIIAFLLTEDMSLPMAFVDKWTILMAVLFGGQIASAVVAKNAAEAEYEEEEE